MNLYHIPQNDLFPEYIDVVVEIPKGSRNKVEFDPDKGVFALDRVLHSPVHYPGDYGFAPRTLSPDGDALDVLVLVTDPTFTGCVISSRPIGLLEMKDVGEVDEKVLAVPGKDPRFREMRNISDLPRHHLKEVEYFFNVYKELEGKDTAILGWQPVEDAYEFIQRAARAYARKYSS